MSGMVSWGKGEVRPGDLGKRRPGVEKPDRSPEKGSFRCHSFCRNRKNYSTQSGDFEI